MPNLVEGYDGEAYLTVVKHDSSLIIRCLVAVFSFLAKIGFTHAEQEARSLLLTVVTDDACFYADNVFFKGIQVEVIFADQVLDSFKKETMPLYSFLASVVNSPIDLLKRAIDYLMDCAISVTFLSTSLGSVWGLNSSPMKPRYPNSSIFLNTLA